MSTESKNLIKKARTDVLSSEELLILKSRTFVVPITCLETMCGPAEFNKRVFVRTLYNSLREADEFEDGRFPLNEKSEGFKKLNYALSEIARRDGGPIDDLLTNGLKSTTNSLLRYPMDEETRVFFDQFAKGAVLKEMQKLPREEREMIRNCTHTMISGMDESLTRTECATIEELLKYCDYVAGVVGETLTDEVNLRDKKVLESKNIVLDRVDGKLLGRALQLTNIVKNIREDAEARDAYPASRAIFVPRSLYSGRAFFDVLGADAEKAKRQEIFDVLFAEVNAILPAVRRYIQSIPDELSGYKAFCLIPALAAIETWTRMATAGPERVFRGEEEAIKISRQQFGNIVEWTRRIIPSGRTNEWLDLYLDKPIRSRFTEGPKRTEYSYWSKKYLSQ